MKKLDDNRCVLLPWMEPFRNYGYCVVRDTPKVAWPGTYFFHLTKNFTLTKSMIIPNQDWPNTLVIDADFTIAAGGTLQVGQGKTPNGSSAEARVVVGPAGTTGSINNYASIVVNTGGSLVISHLVNNQPEATITNTGGSITVNRPSGHKGLQNAGIIMLDAGQFFNWGVVNNYAGTITNASDFLNIGVLKNFSSYINPRDTGAPGPLPAMAPLIINKGVLRNGHPQDWPIFTKVTGVIINGGGTIHNEGGKIYNLRNSIIRNSWLIKNTLGYGIFPHKVGTYGKIINHVGGLIINTTSYAAKDGWPITHPVPLHPPPDAICNWSKAGIGKIVNDQACTIINDGTIIIQGPLKSDRVYHPAQTQFQNNGILQNHKFGKIYLIDHAPSTASHTKGASQFNNGTPNGSSSLFFKCVNNGLIKCTTTEDAPLPYQKPSSGRRCTTGTKGCIKLYVPIEGNSPDGTSDCS